MPAGQRFTFLYRDRSAKIPDSPRMRMRLAESLNAILSGSHSYNVRSTASLLRQEIGVPVFAQHGGDIRKVFAELSHDDLLDAVTVIYRGFKPREPSRSQMWLEAVEKIFSEELISLSVDMSGGVHFAVDEEFAHGRQLAIDALGQARYNAVADFIHQSHAALDSRPADTRQAVRAMYEAIENLFKLMLPGQVSRLGKSEIDKHLKPKIADVYAGHDLDAAKLMLSSLSEWVNGMQQYRHAAGVTEPSGPPIDLAILIMSAGSSFLRWLLRIDADMIAAAA